MAYEVQTEVYQGPFDLLLQLILTDEVELYEISLVDIVDAYLTEIDRMEMCDLEVATEFLLIAATLVELKARRLLPDDRELDLDDEFGLWEQRDLLLAKLLECKTFKDAATVLRSLSAQADRSYARRAGLDEAFIGLAPDLLTGVTAIDVRDAYVRALTPRPEPRVDLFHVNPITVTVHDAVIELIDELPRVGRVSFRELTEGLVDRIEVVVRFLAVLELFKQNLVEIEQVRTFGEIVIRWIGSAEAVAELEIDRYEG
ncbi:MAG: segregation/condensation protein A [Acidimicrobiia bacterium]|nr:segregation/condensation protein A [Acidimicrobiia bacterium]